MGGQRRTSSEARNLSVLESLAGYGYDIPVEHAREMIVAVSTVFRRLMSQAGHDPRQITKITTKLRDSGRRSPPWKPTSSIVPGRPQSGADGNRISRWLLPEGHKFHADEVTATLVEVRYYLQALSMDGAPSMPAAFVRDSFAWLVEHPVEPGAYVDPIQLIPIDLHRVVDDARLIQSGHLLPLDRGGRHEPKNTYLMHARSNQLQGNLTVDEMVTVMEEIVMRHRQRRSDEARLP